MIVLIGYGGCGFTFLDWSLRFVSGGDVLANPLTDSGTAHHHETFHYVGPWRQPREPVTYWVPGHQRHLSAALPDLSQHRIVCFDSLDRDEKLFLLSRSQQHMPHLGWYSDYQNCLAHGLTQRAVNAVFARSIDRYVGYIDFSVIPDACHISLRRLFLSLDQILPCMAQDLGMVIDDVRWKDWLEIYRRWQARNPWKQSSTVREIFQSTTEEIPVIDMANAARWLRRFWDQ